MAGRRKKPALWSDVERAVWGPRTVGDHLHAHGWIEDKAVVAGKETVRWHLPGDDTLRTTGDAWEYTMVNFLGAPVYSGSRSSISYQSEWDIESIATNTG